MVFPTAVDFSWARPVWDAPSNPSADRAETSEQLWGQIQAAHALNGLDAVISYCFSPDLEPALVQRTVELGVPWINFFCDSTFAFDFVESLARTTSLNWFPESAAVPQYRALGRPLLCRPYAIHPAALPEEICQTATHAVGFVGGQTRNRVLHLAKLWLAGCPVTVRGGGWQSSSTTPAVRSSPHTRPPAPIDRRFRPKLGERLLARALSPLVGRGARSLTDDEMLQFLSRCRVVLGLNESRDFLGTYRSYLKLRDIEFPGYGCCYLTQHNEDIGQIFDVGREVLTFRHAREAAGHVRDCVRHPDKARAIGQSARRRVLAEHNWTARLSELARAL